MQFITGNVQGVFLLSFLCFMLMPLPLLLFVRTTQVHGKAALDICALGLMLNMLLCLALHFGGVAPLSDTVWMTHLWLLGCMVLLFVLCIRERRVYRHTAAREILIALVEMCIRDSSTCLAVSMGPPNRLRPSFHQVNLQPSRQRVQ